MVAQNYVVHSKIPWLPAAPVKKQLIFLCFWGSSPWVLNHTQLSANETVHANVVPNS
jgi:hypothetical protein